jgi:hypothetical protein
MCTGIIGDDRQQLLDSFASLRGNNAKLSQVRSHSIDQLRALDHQKVAGPMLHQLGLLFGRLHLNETHGGPTYRLTNRLGIGCIVLVALDVGLHVLRWHQSDFVTELGEFSGPIVRRGAGL